VPPAAVRRRRREPAAAVQGSAALPRGPVSDRSRPHRMALCASAGDGAGSRGPAASFARGPWHRCGPAARPAVAPPLAVRRLATAAAAGAGAGPAATRCRGRWQAAARDRRAAARGYRQGARCCLRRPAWPVRRPPLPLSDPPCRPRGGPIAAGAVAARDRAAAPPSHPGRSRPKRRPPSRAAVAAAFGAGGCAAAARLHRPAVMARPPPRAAEPMGRGRAARLLDFRKTAARGVSLNGRA
jgi:hypothetical protein